MVPRRRSRGPATGHGRGVRTIRGLARSATATWPRTLATGFAATRVAYFAMGVRFDDTPVRLSVMQLLDPHLLRHDLVGSVWYLHAQPPLYNLVAGAYLHLPGWLRSPVATLSGLGLGLAVAFSIYHLLTELGCTEKTGAITALAFAASPATVLWENVFFYTYFVAAALVGSAALLLRYRRTGRPAPLVGFAALIAAAALTRSTYHLVWVVAVVAFVVASSPGTRRRVLAASAVPLVLVGGWYVKNLAYFDSFSSSSWLGMNLAHATFRWMDRYELHELVDRDVTSELVLIQPFSPKQRYSPRFVEVEHTGIAALDQRSKSTTTWGLWAGNYNNLVYLRISPKYQDDVWRFIQAEPARYAQIVAAAGRFAFLPPDDHLLVDANARHIRPLVWLVDRVALGSPTEYRFTVPDGQPFTGVTGAYPRPSDVAWILLAGYLMVLVGGPVLAWRRRRTDGAGALTIAYLWGLTAFTTVTGIFLETGENSRLRFEADPMALVLGVLIVVEVVRGRRARASRVATGDDAPTPALVEAGRP